MEALPHDDSPRHEPDSSEESPIPAASRGRPFDPEDFKRRLTDEYKILQDKVDKIGAFRFTIKGWSVTAVIAASAAAGSAKSLTTVFTISLGLAFMVFFFFYLELDRSS
ncbi:MAG: hypothetical protein M3O35_22310 [Acidobacteriota bacterium]|nr:hypothetical protein [Acidobacteriota bacterium]